MNEKRNYVIALSGGVDSVVLLDALANDRLSELTGFSFEFSDLNVTVAHFDHGIREDSATDEQFARGVAGEYGLPYLTERVALGSGASEEEARIMRYNFLRQCCKSNNAQLITAHHQDDALETMVINLIRGTGWRGLAPMAQISNPESQISNNNQISNIKSQILRPLLDVPKKRILEYAKKYNLKWREDSTNTDQNYLRNYVRLTLLPAMYKKDPEARTKLLKINKNLTDTKGNIATELQKLLLKCRVTNLKYQIPRYDLIMYPPLVASELIHSVLTNLDPDWHPSSFQIKRTLHFIKTGIPGKQMEISKYLNISLEKGVVQFKKV